jgi:glycosyltransferase involved in cell wall biosynthesis
MRIAFVVHEYAPLPTLGGTGRYAASAAKALRELGHEVLVFTFHGYAETLTEWSDTHEGVSVWRVSPPFPSLEETIRNPAIEAAFERWLDTNPVDLVHFQHTIFLGMGLPAVAKRRSLPVVLSLHDFWLTCHRAHLNFPQSDRQGLSLCVPPVDHRQCASCIVDLYQLSVPPEQTLPLLPVREKLAKEALAVADRVICGAAHTRRTFEETLAWPANYVTLPYGIEPISPPPRPKIANDIPTFGIMGNISKIKGLDVLLTAFREVADQARLIVFGEFADEPWYLERLQQLSAGVPSILFYGKYELDKALSLLDVLVIPSLLENYPLVALEAFMAKVPIVASDIGGLPEVVSHGVDGMLFERGNAAELANVLRALAQDRDLIARLKQGIRQPFTTLEHARGLLAHYEAILGKPAVPSPGPLASIVIPLFNKVEYTEQCLEALISNTPEDLYEVILVDNASSDGTAELLASLEGDVQVIRNPENMGFARACNQGAALARGQYVIVLNNDTLPQPGWLEALIAEADADPSVGLVGCKLLYPDTGKVQHAGIGWIDGLPDHPFRHADAQAPEVNQVRDLDMVTGACMLIRRDVFERVGGFDDGFLNGAEDIDLCLQVRRAGYRVRYTPESVLFHHEGVSEGRFAHVTPNLQRFFRRWEGCFDSEQRFVPPSQAVPVRWEGSQFVYHSLAHVNRELCRDLIASGAVDLEVIPYEPHQFNPDPHLPLRPVAQRIGRALPEPAAVHVRHQWPPRFDPPAEGAWVMIQPWEFGGLPADWIAPMRDQVDEIWVYTSWLRDCYIKSGIPADKVHLVPLGVDTALYRPEGETFPLKTNKRFKFLFLGGAISRKGIDILLDTYLATFTAADDVCLIIKTNGANSHYRGSSLDAQIKQLASNPKAPAIEFIDQDLSDAEIAALYRSCHALAHPYRGEGFGMPIVEAMASGLPVIVTGYGACLDFCDEETAFLIPATEVPFSAPDLPPSSIGYWWAEPDRAELGRILRHVVANPDAARTLGQKARQRIVERWQWHHASAVALTRIQALARRTPLRQSADPFNPGVPPLALEGCRSYAFFHHPDWRSAGWQEVLLSYVRAFRAEEDVTLVLWLDPSQGLAAEDVAELVDRALQGAELGDVSLPDLLLVPDALDSAGLAQLMAAVQCVVTDDPIQRERAARMGKPILPDLARESWREAARPTSIRS